MVYRKEETILEPQQESLEKDLDKLNLERWYALYTKSRHEKIVRDELSKKGIESFLPLKKITRNWSDRKKVVEEPLFKGYLFVQTSWKERFEVLKTVGAVHFVAGPAHDPVAVPESEIITLQKFLEEDIPVDPFPYLKKGERVYVRTGPFKGAEGFIVRKDTHCRLVISLDLLMQSVSIQIDAADVEPIT